MKRSKILALVIFILFFGLTRLPFLGRDTINPDAVNWHYRSEQFIVAVKSGEWAKTYQHYHPGVTLMWIMGVPVELYKQLDPSHPVYNNDTFLTFHTISKVTLVAVQLLLSLTAIWFLSRIKRFRTALFTVALFSLEPFFLGNSRLLHLDVLMTLFLFNGLVVNYWTVRDFKWWKAALAGAFYSLAFLTKSISVGALLFGLFIGGFWIYKELHNIKILIKYELPLLLSFVIVMFALFPALWVAPVSTLINICTEGERIGIRGGHGQIVMGEYTRDAAFWFYPLILLMKVSPFTLVGLALYLFFLAKRIRTAKPLNSPELFITIFYLAYVLVMTFPTKKIDRYMVPVFPLLALLSVEGCAHLSKFKYQIIGALLAAFILLPLFSFYPYYFTYTSPLFGSAVNADKIVAQKPFGVAIPALKDFIFQKYGEYPKLGFYDVKPMKSIYMNSRICDVRVCGTDDYDLLVLGPNEELPDKLKDSKYTFRYDSSFEVNGLEYWKIYVKETPGQQ